MDGRAGRPARGGARRSPRRRGHCRRDGELRLQEARSRQGLHRSLPRRVHEPPASDVRRQQHASSRLLHQAEARVGLRLSDDERRHTTVRLRNAPGPIEEGPYPTVVNYSGYSPSRPGRPLGDFDLLCDDLPVLCDAPEPPCSLFAGLMGYATVNVNKRGTGCSGGAYDYFETLQVLDGYDIIEIVAAQEWVLHNHVGMVGLSYPGITQLFVGRSQPPGLAAIAPLSVIGSTHTTLVPGGILNDGFAISWVERVLDRAAPYAQGWEQEMVDAGDLVCEENQLLHSQRFDNVALARSMPFYEPEIVDPLNPEKWVDRIEVPVFIAGAWQDEQTGPNFGDLLGRFESSPDVMAMAQNGVHIDAFAPAFMYEWVVFLDLFVARKVPSVPPAARSLAPLFFENLFGARMSLPPERFEDFDSYEEALAAWRAEPKLKLVFESGAGEHTGAPDPTFHLDFDSWPPPGEARRWYLHPQGRLLNEPASSGGFSASEYLHDPEAGQRGILVSGVWSRQPRYDWRQPAPGSAAIFESAPLEETIIMAGTGSADLWIRSSADEADIEVNLTEVRPDGQEMYVQSGWLRASQRALSEESTEFYPRHTHLEQDAQPLVPGEWVHARVAVAPFQHVFREGSRIRLSVDTPGDSRAEWRFDLASVPEGTTISVGHDADRPSSLVLPVLTGVSTQSPLADCTLRGQQCRPYEPYQNVQAGAD
ncbi:MAG: CocE/NonD family hydrolase [Myxococcota bacterium]